MGVNTATDERSIKEILDTVGTYTGLTMGTSMQPLLHEQRDNIIIMKNNDRLKKYDVPVYLLPSGKYVMHRVIKVHEDYYTIVGDNLLTREKVTDDMICGVLVGFYKDGKRYVDCQNSKLYKLYSRIWVAFLPIRPLYFKVRGALGKIYRAIFKRGDR